MDQLDDPQEATRAALDGALSGVWTALPCLVESVDLAAMTISAQPAIQARVRGADGARGNVPLPLLVDVPLVFPSAGGHTLTLPIAAGDEVLVVFASRCIDAWWQSGGVQRQAELRMHDLSDGFAIPGPRSQPRVVGGISATAAQLRSDAGDVFLEVDGAGTIRLIAPGSITMTAPTININGNINHTGNASTSGTISAGESVSAPTLAAGSSLTVGGLEMSDHQHDYLRGGSGSAVTGGPI